MGDAGSIRSPRHRLYQSVVKPGEWNTARLRATASHMELWINGRPVLRRSTIIRRKSPGPAGLLAFQVQSDKGPAKIRVPENDARRPRRHRAAVLRQSCHMPSTRWTLHRFKPLALTASR